MAYFIGKSTIFTILTIFVIARAWSLPTSDRLRKSAPQFVSNNLDFDYDSIQPNPKEVTPSTSPIEQSTMNNQNKEDNFIIYSSTSNRPSMSTPKITTQATESTVIDGKASLAKAEDIAPTQHSMNNVPEHKDSNVETSVKEGQAPVTTEESIKSVSEHTESSVESMIITNAEGLVPTQQSVESVSGHEESSVELSVTKIQVPVPTEESLIDSVHEENPHIEQIESTKDVDATTAPVTTEIEDKEESSTTKMATTSFESPTENNQETTTIRLCGSCDNLNDVNNNKPIEIEKHVVDYNSENHSTTVPNQSLTNIENTISHTSTESSIQSEFTTIADATTSITEILSVPVETETTIQEVSRPSASDMNQPNNFEMPSQSDPNDNGAAIVTTTITDETMPSKMSEINESKETTTIISQTTEDPEMTSQRDLNSNASILASYHVWKYLIVFCVIIIFQQSHCCI